MLLRERLRKQSICLATIAGLFFLSTAAHAQQNESARQTRIGMTSQTVKTSTTKAKSTYDEAANQRYKELNKPKESGVKPTLKTKTNARRSSTQLVPPPPPTIPTYLNVPQGSAFTELGLGFTIQTLSADDLKFQLKNVEKKLEAAKLDERDQKKATEEKQDRAKRFVDLFGEGVVSRRELETSKEEAERANRDLEQAHVKVTEFERVLNQVKDRIQALEAAKKPVRSSPKKSRHK